jgi:hypothetical protein
MGISLVTGWTEDIDYVLKTRAVDETVATAVDVSGMDVAIQARDQHGNIIPLNGELTVTDAANGKVRFVPAAADINRATASTYYVRWKVTDGGGNISYFPHEGAEEWTIRD